MAPIHRQSSIDTQSGSLLWLFGSPLLADVELCISASGSTPALKPKPLLAHGVILCQQSELYKDLIMEFWRARSEGVAGSTAAGAVPPLLQIKLSVPPRDLEAAILVLKAMYDPNVLLDTAQAPNIESVIQCVRVADGWRADSVLQSALRRLEGDLAAGYWTWQATAALLELPSLLLSSAPLTKLFQHAKTELVGLFGNLEQAWTQPELRSRFLSLSYDVLITLLTGSIIKVSSENTVFLAVTDYVEHGRGRDSLSPSNLLSLLQCIHMAHVSPSFFLSQVLNRPWVQQATSAPVATLPRLQASGSASPSSSSYVPHSCTLQQQLVDTASPIQESDSILAGGALGLPYVTQQVPGHPVLAMCAQYFLSRDVNMQGSPAMECLPSWMRLPSRPVPAADECGILSLDVPLHKLKASAATLGIASPQTPRSKRLGSSTPARAKAKDAARRISGPNLVPSPTLVWGGYVWSLDVFLACDPEPVLGVSVHAVCPAFGLPASPPAPSSTHSAAGSVPPGSLPLSSTVRPQQCADDFLASIPPVRTRRTGESGGDLGRMGAAHHMPTSQLQGVTDADALAAGSSSSNAAAGTNSPPAVPDGTPPLSGLPPLPASGSAQWGISATMVISMWHQALGKWTHVFPQAVTAHTNLELLPPEAVPSEASTTTRRDMPRHAHRYRVTYTDYHPVMNEDGLEALLSSAHSWQRTAYASSGSIRLRAQLMSVQ